MTIPLQKLPSPGPDRVETGPVQFGEDWPGVFIRGDNALMGYLPSLASLVADPAFQKSHPLEVMMLTGLRDLMASCSAFPLPAALMPK